MRSKDFLLTFVKNSPLFSAVTMLCVATAWAAPIEPPVAFRSPNWGFKKIPVVSHAHPLSKSLIFDQNFDKVSYRPAPQTYAAIPFIPRQASEPTPVMKAKTLPIEKQIEGFSPFFVERSMPMTQTPALAKVAPNQGQDLAMGEAIQNVIESRKQERLANNIPAAKSENSTPMNPAKVSESRTSTTVTFVTPQPDESVARIIVLDEESLLNKNPKAVPGAKVSWTGYRSGLITETDRAGLARPPYPNVQSMRFVVEAEGYLPAVGYAVMGVVTPVVLVPEKRLAPILQSLGIVPEAGKTLVLGKVLDKKMRPVAGVSIDESPQAPGKVFYSAGSFGVFHAAMKETGPQGDFLITGLRKGLQYIMPTQNLGVDPRRGFPGEELDIKEWPSFIGDFSALPQVVSVAIQEGSRSNLKTQIVDSMSMTKPSSGVHATIGGQRGLFIPDDAGFVRLNDLFLRPSVDLIEVHSPGYLKSWATPIASKQSLPDPLLLFSREQLQSTFQGVDRDVNLSLGVVLGQVQVEKFLHPVIAEVFAYNGKRSKKAEVFYFDDRGLNGALKQSALGVGAFAIANLDDGEWHVLLLDAATRMPVSGQVVRVQKNTVSQIQF